MWCGEEAVECGLVDGVGGFVEAVALATARCGLKRDEFRVVEYGSSIDQWEEILTQMMGGVRAGLFGGLFREVSDLLSMEDGVMALSSERVNF